MELFNVVAILATILMLYFFLGITLKFLWGWWILIVATPICVFVGIQYGWLGAIGGLVGWSVSLAMNNEWHDTKLYFAVTDALDKVFNFNDT